MIKFLRIDSRLIHGQIVEGWLRFTTVDEVLIIDDFISEGSFEKKILRFALPADIEMEVLSVREAVARWTDVRSSSKRFFILIQSIDMLDRLYRCIPGDGREKEGLPTVNLGLINFTDSKTLLTNAVYVDEHEKEQLRALIDSDVQIYAQALPSNEKTFIAPLLGSVDADERGDNNG